MWGRHVDSHFLHSQCKNNDNKIQPQESTPNSSKFQIVRNIWNTPSEHAQFAPAMASHPTEVVVPPMPEDGFVPFRRRRSRLECPDSSWAPKWRKVLVPPPDSDLVVGAGGLEKGDMK